MPSRAREAMSVSMNGRISGSNSTTSTREPSAAKREANSTPMTPPPMTTRRSGMWSIASSPVESTTRPSAPGIGGMTGSEPVAMMT